MLNTPASLVFLSLSWMTTIESQEISAVEKKKEKGDSGIFSHIPFLSLSSTSALSVVALLGWWWWWG